MFTAAVVVFLVRLVAIWAGAWLGCTSTATVPEFRRLFWMSMVTQAGVAMGLARLAGTRFPDWGPHFQTYMVGAALRAVYAWRAGCRKACPGTCTSPGTRVGGVQRITRLRPTCTVLTS